jgi:glycosyltransferase involved in cell wall biosynthesis
MIHPLFSRRFDKSILKRLKTIAPEYDIIVFNFSQVALYSLFLEHPYKIIISHDVIYQKYARKKHIMAPWIKLNESRIFKSARKIFVLSKKDADIIKAEYGFDAYVINGYLSSFYFYKMDKLKNIFVFFGFWKRKENLDGLLWFIKKVYPLLNPCLEIKFIIIGGGLDEKIQKKITGKGFEYLGFVPNHLDIIYESKAVIAPLFSGAGVKIKVIDSFSTGTPVIGTSIAFEGLPIVNDLVCPAETPAEFAGFINKFEIKYKKKKENAKRFRLSYGNRRLVELL